MYLGISMFWITTVYRINNIPKRNLILESIGNIFIGKSKFYVLFGGTNIIFLWLVLRDSISKLRYCTSKPCEHMFGNIHQSDWEFMCSDFSNNIDKQNRKFDLTYNSNLSIAKEDIQSGY